MGIKSRLKRERRRIEGEASRVDYAGLSDAIDAIMQQLCGDQRFRQCADYALLGTKWLNARSNVTHAPVGGTIFVPVQGLPGFGKGVVFDHYWIVRDAAGKRSVVDLATRFIGKIVAEGRRAGDRVVDWDKVMFDPELLSRKFHVGGTRAPGWTYRPTKDHTEWLLKQYLGIGDMNDRIDAELGRLRGAI